MMSRKSLARQGIDIISGSGSLSISVQSCPQTLPQCPHESVVPHPVHHSKTVLELPQSKPKTFPELSLVYY